MTLTNEPWALVAPAPPPGVTPVEDTRAERLVEAAPDRLVGDRAYDRDPLDAELRGRGSEVIALHEENRVREETQDGRPPRGYARRWTIERLSSRLRHFRRIVTRSECHGENFLRVRAAGLRGHPPPAMF